MRGSRKRQEQPVDAPADLEPIEWQEQVFIDSLKAAIEKAIESSDGACGTVLTACFSLATAYGAVIALVAPKDEGAPVLVIAPFVLLAAGAVVALIGKAAGVAMDEDIVTHGQVRSAVEQAVSRKRLASWVAVGLAGIGVIFAGWVVFTTYGKSTPTVAPASEIVLSPAGQAQFVAACGVPARPVLGSVTLAGQWVTIKLDSRTVCRTGLDTLTVPSASIKYIHNAR